MKKVVSIITEIPEDLHESLKGYLDLNPTWDQDRVFATALAKFLLQEGVKQSTYEDWKCACIYLGTRFQ